MPTEAEWEYIARLSYASSPEYLTDETVCDFANVYICDNGFDATSPAGSFKSNKFGIYDIQGNVSEWTEDCLHTDYIDAPIDGRARTQGANCDKKVLRGSNWSNDEYDPAYRDSAPDIHIRNSINGFRVARSIIDEDE